MKFQFFIRSLVEPRKLSTVYDALNSGTIEEIVCTSGVLGDIVDQAPRDKIIAVIDYPYGHSSFYARESDVNYCIEMGVKQIEMPINADVILTGDSLCIAEEFNSLYEDAAKHGVIIKPLIDYRLILDNTKHNYFPDLIYFLKEQIGIDSITINSGNMSDYLEENIKICTVLQDKKIKATTFRELYSKTDIIKLRDCAYRVRFSGIRSLKLID